MSGTIRRRVLLNYRADPQIIQAQLPPQFRPQLHKGHAVVGVCLIRLEKISGRRCCRFPWEFTAKTLRIVSP